MSDVVLRYKSVIEVELLGAGTSVCWYLWCPAALGGMEHLTQPCPAAFFTKHHCKGELLEMSGEK